MDISSLFRAKQAWNTFSQNHPKFPPFLSALKAKGISEDTEILISVTYPDGQNMRAGLKIKHSDLELLQMLESLNND